MLPILYSTTDDAVNRRWNAKDCCEEINQLEKPQLLMQSLDEELRGMHDSLITQAQLGALQQHTVPCDTPL